MGKIKVGGILKRTGLTKLGVMSAPDRPGIASTVFEALGKAGLNVEFIIVGIDLTNHTHVILCVAEEYADEAQKVLEEVKTAVGARAVVRQDHIAVISVFGPDFRERPAIAGTVFGALASAGINILAVSTSISTISCVIDSDKLEEAIKALEQAVETP